MTERWRWLWLVLTLIFSFGGGLGLAILYISNVEQAGQRDLCELVEVFADPSAPPPTTERGRQQQDAVRAYRLKRC